jgi:hypothetical protein
MRATSLFSSFINVILIFIYVSPFYIILFILILYELLILYVRRACIVNHLLKKNKSTLRELSIVLNKNFVDVSLLFLSSDMIHEVSNSRQ